MTRSDRSQRPDLGAQLILAGSSLFAFSALTSALFAIFYGLGEAFPGSGVPVPVSIVVSLAAVAIAGLLTLGVGLAMSALVPRDTELITLPQGEPQARRAA